MKTVGIIAEFNPFHNGHKYLIRQAKNLTKSDNVVVICSGNYVQRGAPAVYDKSIRTEMALKNGADVIFELPVFYSNMSADQFAMAGVNFLDKLGCIDYLCFGCESEDINVLSSIAEILFSEPADYKLCLNELIKKGISYPKAVSTALGQYCKNNNILSEQTVCHVMSQPNNILAIEYLKSLKVLHSSIVPVAVKRKGEKHHSLSTGSSYSSATAIRDEITNNHSIDKFIPENCRDIAQKAHFITASDFNKILGYTLLLHENFNQYAGVTKELSNRIKKCRKDYTDMDSFIKTLQTKNFIYSGISRALINILLDIKDNDINKFIENNYFSYARYLGFNSNSPIMSAVKEKSTLKPIGKLWDYYNQSTGIERKMLDICIRADDIYRMVYMTKYKIKIPSEFERQIIVK